MNNNFKTEIIQLKNIVRNIGRICDDCLEKIKNIDSKIKNIKNVDDEIKMIIKYKNKIYQIIINKNCSYEDFLNRIYNNISGINIGNLKIYYWNKFGEKK